MKTIAFSDLHGNYKLWTAIKNYYGENDTLIFLGDACDRGPDGIKILQEMFNDKRVIFLLGNHEQMLLDFIEMNIYDDASKEIIEANGCRPTLIEYEKLSEVEKNILVNNLKNNTKLYYIYINKDKKNIFLSHAGTDMSKINDVSVHSLLWNRDHIKLDAQFDSKYKYWYVVHGHTPVQVVLPDKSVIEVLRYYNRHKIDLDLGTYVTNITATLDLDTLEVKYFKGDLTNDN